MFNFCNLYETHAFSGVFNRAAITSIYRPGPLSAGVHKIYAEAKQDPDSVDYHHPLIERVLKSTHGAIIFQEQVMELCNVVAGFPQADCDKIRRTIMKRSASKADSMKQAAYALKESFVEGCVRNGVGPRVATGLYEKILFFSGYGFNKSHAVSYAIGSYYCAWLMTYYEEEWLCAYLEAMSNNPKKRSKALSEIKKLGYMTVPIDINYATKSWTILDGKKFMPSFLSCKGIGDAAIDEILSNRPYNTIQKLLWDGEGKWRHSKFNKRALENLIKLRAFDSMDLVGDGKIFCSYAQMHEILIEKNAEIKKWTKRDNQRGQKAFNSMLLEMCDTPEWSKPTFANFSVDIMGSFSPGMFMSEELHDQLAERGINSIDDVNEKDLYWFIVVDVKSKLTRNSHPYLLLTVSGMSGGNHRVFCWGWDGETEIPKYSLCVAEIEKNDFGCATRQRKIKVLN